jgi:hypothetical protein
MANEDDKAVVRSWTAAWNDHDPDAAASLLTQAYVRHDPNGPEVVGRRAQRCSCRPSSTPSRT